MTGIDTRALDRELKRGSAELLILSLLDARPRHGYELSKLIHAALWGPANIPYRFPLSLALSTRGARMDQGRLGREARGAAPPLLQGHYGRATRVGSEEEDMGSIRRGCAARHGRRTCLTGLNMCARVCRRYVSRLVARPKSSKNSRNISMTAGGN